ncbi:MAG TPA: carboxypeptidase-like regulatory domain-containing protein, partial [Vicinamibacterales bacterium]|nr:carboxypeptidase-like regulatory domain-containing protein [Vicinamibacterales bacterium]
MSRALVVLVALVASAGVYHPLLAQDRPAQTPARDNSARPSTGTGIIRGRVTEAGTDRPLARVDIRAISPVVSQPRGVKTDASGQYEVTGLPPGRYVVAASKTNYLTTSFGATRAMGPGKGFDLADGQIAEKVNFALLHAGVIAGRVIDELGDPVVDAQVITFRYQY